MIFQCLLKSLHSRSMPVIGTPILDGMKFDSGHKKIPEEWSDCDDPGVLEFAFIDAWNWPFGTIVGS